MKCLSLWQPWASLVVLGEKRIETRSWATKYRGPLLIHASKRKNTGELIELLCSWQYTDFQKALASLGPGPVAVQTNLPYGAVIGRVELVDCRTADSFTNEELEKERGFGDFRTGRFGWVLENAKIFDQPLSCNGSLGLFEVPDEMLLQACAERSDNQ